MFKLITLICSLISLTFADYEYDAVSLPDGLTAGILDSPHYDERTRNLYFIGLFTPYVYRYSEDDNRIYYCILPNLQAGSFTPSKTDPYTFFAGFNNTMYIVKWDGFSKQCNIMGQLFTGTLGSNPNMNQAIGGPKGALYTGTVSFTQLCGGPANQGFYQYTRQYGLKVIPGAFKTTNSLGFDYKRYILYHLDGCTQQLIAYKISKHGSICKSWVVLNSFGMPSSGAPVGIAMLPNGNFYVSSYKYGVLFTVDPFAKRIIDQEELPTYYSAGIAWGGRGMNILYLLTATTDADITTGQPNNVTVKPPAGQLVILRGLGRGIGVRRPCLSCY